MTRIDRRTFLRGSAAAAGATMLGGPFQGFIARAALAAPPAPVNVLGPVEDKRDGIVRLWLPEGFQYRSFHDTETPVTLPDGTNLPGRHDGMAAFAGPGENVTLVRNHEVNNPGSTFGPGTPYDTAARGGTTTIVVTPKGKVVDAYTSLNGTQMNCSGGPMPWGSWITCEETVNGPDVGRDFTGVSNVPLKQRHGFVFEVPADGQSSRQPITAAGRFAHEAVAWDPVEGILYLTEDNFGFPSGFFRYIPATDPMATGSLDNDGQLQMLAVAGEPNKQLATAQTAGATFDVEWVDIEDPAPTFPFTPGQEPATTNNQALVHVGSQGRAQGAAWFSRLEGSVYEDGAVFFTSTQGGGGSPPPPEQWPAEPQGYGNGTGQVWAYRIDEQVLECVFQSPGAAVLDFPDNVTTSARGTLVLCEDSTGDNFLRGLTRDGELFDIALNRLRNGSTGAPRFGDEFAGSTFSPDGSTLFVNIQASAGMTFAIWGPWARIGV
jgi:secreted PhoX family phosphatase